MRAAARHPAPRNQGASAAGNPGIAVGAMRNIIAAIPRSEAVLPLLLGALLLMILVAWPLADLGILEPTLLSMMMVVIVLTGLRALGDSGRLARPAFFLGLPFFAVQLALATRPSPAFLLASDATAAAFLLLLSAVLLRGVLRAGRVNVQRIVGAVVVYLLLALLFAVSFNLTERLAPGAFNMGPESAGGTPAGARFFYLSIITLTSVGFGDMSPIHPVARALVMAEALTGQLFTTILLARLVSLEIEHRRTPDRGGP